LTILGSEFGSFGFKRLELVPQIFASWNQKPGWVRRLAALQDAVSS